MFERSVKLGRIFGIDLQAHWSLLIIFLLIATHLGFGVLPAWHPTWSVALISLVAVTASVIFFASILVHEMAHAIAARGYGLEVGDITLFLFGGVSNIESEPESPMSEAVIALVGPLTSLVLGVAMIAAVGATLPNLEQLQAEPEAFLSQLGPIATTFVWVGPINLLLAAFNMIPAFPMDGGRVLRAGIWGVTGNLERATRVAAAISRGISWVFIGIGVAMALGVSIPFFGTGLVAGLWLAVIGWFIGQAARATVVMNEISAALEGFKARDIATSDVAIVSPETPIEQVVQRYLRGSADERILVRDGDQFAGMVDIDALRSVDRERWSGVTVGEVMQSREAFDTIDAETDAFQAFKQLQSGRQQELPVTDQEGRLEGVLRLSDVARWFRVYGPGKQRKTMA